jgi:O-antigen/teichoic acid export membrane protein
LLRRLLKSITAIFAGQFLNIAGNLALVPLFLSRWPTSVYGEWMALSAVVAYFGVTDLGMNSAAGNAMTAAYACGDLKRYRYLQGSAIAFYIGMALSMSLLFAILVIFLPVPAWIGIRQIPSSMASPVIWLMATTILWQMPTAQLRCIYRTTGDLASTQWFWNLQFIGTLAVTATVLLLHGGVLDLALWGTAPTILVAGAIWFGLRRSHPELLPSLSGARFAGIRELLGPSLLFGLIMLSMALTLQGPVLIVSRALGGAAVALLVTTRTLANVLRQAIGALQAALWPELTRLGALGAEQTLQFAHRIFTLSAVILSAAFAGALWFEGPGVISIWTRGKLTPDTWLLRFFLVALVLQAPWLASSLFAIANNRHRRLAYSYAASATLTLAAILTLIRPLGLIAVPLGAIVGEALASYHFVVKDACHVLHVDYPRFALRIWVGVAVISCAAWCAGYLGHRIAVGPAPFRWAEAGALTIGASFLAAWSLVLKRDDRPRLLVWVNARWLTASTSTAKQPA